MIQQGKTYITNFYGTNVMKIQILEVTEKTVLWKNLDSSNKDNTCRSTLDDFKFHHKVLEEINECVNEPEQLEEDYDDEPQDALPTYIEIRAENGTFSFPVRSVEYTSVGLKLDIEPHIEIELIQWLEENT